jgi:hypothetical protein
LLNVLMAASERLIVFPTLAGILLWRSSLELGAWELLLEYFYETSCEAVKNNGKSRNSG